MRNWIGPVIDRGQTRLFYPTLEEMIGESDPVRIVDEILSSIDWSEAEDNYESHLGRTTYHCQDLCALLIFGLLMGIRSSRKLEYACKKNIDFIWLLWGRVPDHSTIAAFHAESSSLVKSVFAQVGRIALDMGYIALVDVATDGTQVRSNNSRFATATREKLEERLAKLNEFLATGLEELAAEDEKDTQQHGDSNPQTEVPEELSSKEEREEKLKKSYQREKEKIEKAMEEVDKVDEARRKRGEQKPGQVPLHESESRVLPNKDGGYAPNVTPVVSTDSKHGFIVDVDVINDSDEAGVQRAAVDRIEETFGKKPECMLGDGAFISTEHIVAMEEAGVELLAPVKDSFPQEDSPALREDLREPVATEQLPQLPMNPQTKKFDKSCFCYDAADDCYYCPNGERLDFQKIENKGDERIIRMYQSSDCSNCSLSSECLNNPPTPRTIQISIHEPLRQKVIDRMSTDAGKQRYNMRSWIAETPFAYIK